MTFLLPSAQLRQVADLLRCCQQTGATITGDQAARAAAYLEHLAKGVERLETFATEAERDAFDEAFAPLVQRPAEAPA